jgi:putative Mg2+ transporter-C (MgtC) family protein
MDPLYLRIASHLCAGLLAGGVIGLERSYHGRPAGFRTHTLVCMASSLLMLLTVYESRWFPGARDSVRLDPTRMAQGIMTGIGFLGAGVIFKEGLTVRGLTTAASIWTTSAIGVLMGTGLYFAGTLATVLTLGVLAAFRWFEDWIPSQQYAQCIVRFERGNVLPEPQLRRMLAEQGFTVSGFSYRLADEGLAFEYRMTIRTNHRRDFAALAGALGGVAAVREFEIAPTSE